MANREERRRAARSQIPDGQWSNAQRDQIIRALAAKLLDLEDHMEEGRKAHNSLVDEVNQQGMQISALEGGKQPMKKDDELLKKVMGAIAALPPGFHFNARNIADTLSEDNGKVHQKLMVLVRAGKVTQHKVDGRNASFTIALKEG